MTMATLIRRVFGRVGRQLAGVVPKKGFIPDVTGLLRTFRVSREAHREAMVAAGSTHINLYLHASCSHGCPYCVSNMHKARRQNGIADKIGTEAYLSNILRLAGDRKVSYSFSGPGECPEHPAFTAIVQGVLNAGHRVYIQSHGLTSKRLSKTFECYDRQFVAEHVSFGLSFHFGAYLDDDNDRRLRTYLEDHFPRIVGIGAPMTIIVPLSPKVLKDDRFEAYLHDFQRQAEDAGLARLTINLVELQGHYDGKKYPRDFTEAERARICELFGRFGSSRDIAVAEDDLRNLSGPLFLKGMPCYVSTHLIEVLPNGDLRHCQGAPKITTGGHLLDDEFVISLQDGPRPCPYDKCLCKTGGIRNCLRPLGISLGDYFAEVERVCRESGVKMPGRLGW